MEGWVLDVEWAGIGGLALGAGMRGYGVREDQKNGKRNTALWETCISGATYSARHLLQMPVFRYLRLIIFLVFVFAAFSQGVLFSSPARDI